MIRKDLHHLHLLGSTTVHIVDNMIHHLVQTSRNRFWQGTDLGESVCNQLETTDILIHFRYQFIVRIIHLQNLYPSHQT